METENVEEATVLDEDIKPKETKSRKIETKEDWEELLSKLANKKCNARGCHGRGYTGWNNETSMPIGCTAQRCSLRKLQEIQRQQKINALRKKQAEAKESLKKASKGMEEVKEATDKATEAIGEFKEAVEAPIENESEVNNDTAID